MNSESRCALRQKRICLRCTPGEIDDEEHLLFSFNYYIRNCKLELIFFFNFTYLSNSNKLAQFNIYWFLANLIEKQRIWDTHVTQNPYVHDKNTKKQKNRAFIAILHLL